MEKQILKILERDARTSPAEIAVMLGKTEDEVRACVKEMEASGVIRR